MPSPPHRRGPYRRLAKLVTDAAYADPTTRCWRCGLTLAQHPRTRTGKVPTWDAGHLVDGDPNSPLLPEASVCNRRAGGQLGNDRRYAAQRAWRTSNDW
jgi:hypothetical protein